MTNLMNFSDILEMSKDKNKKLYEICELLEAENTEISVEEIR